MCGVTVYPAHKIALESHGLMQHLYGSYWGRTHIGPETQTKNFHNLT